MKSIQLLFSGKPILINLDQIVAIGVCQYDEKKIWIDCTNGEEYVVETPFEEVLKYIPSE